jgi:hypothetical protein
MESGNLKRIGNYKVAELTLVVAELALVVAEVVLVVAEVAEVTVEVAEGVSETLVAGGQLPRRSHDSRPHSAE